MNLHHVKYWWLLAIVPLILISLPGNSQAANSNVIVAAEGISLSVDFGNGTIIQYYDLNGTTVLEVTSSILEVQVQWYGPLAYIRAIEGIVGEGQYGWQYWVNSEFAAGAVNLYTLADGDSIEWVYSGPESQPQPQYDSSLLPGATAVSAAAIGFIVIIYIQTSRRLQ
jgi:hypothetical protein